MSDYCCPPEDCTFGCRVGERREGMRDRLARFVEEEKEILDRLEDGPPAERHPNSARFHELLEEAGELHDMKQADYGSDADPFANVRSSADFGIPAWIGAAIRLNDKVRRLQAFAKKGELKNEAVVDSFMDIAVYALIARVLYEQESGGV